MASAADDRYEQEQARLRASLDGTSDAEISIPPPRDPEVNPEVYKDVVPLLSRGFLTVPAEINDVLFVFKSLNHHEFEMLRLMGGFQHDRAPSQMFWNLFLAYGVFMVDGMNVLSDRERSVRELARTFAEFPAGARGKLIRNLSELNRRSNVATILTEAYVTEAYSRYRWAQVRGLDLMVPTVTGISGTERLGLNYAQLTWRALNYYEDTSEQMEREWENAKFVGACMAGKGIQKVHSSDERRREKHRETLLARKDRVIRHALFGDPIDAEAEMKGDKVVIAARTVEDLSAQLQSSLRGEKDWHDEVVAEHERRVRERYEQQGQKLQTVLASRKEEYGDHEVAGETEMAGLSQAEVQERVARQRQRRAEQSAQRVYPQLDEKVDRHINKWVLPGAEVGTSLTETDRDPTEALPLPPLTTPGKPFRR